MMPIEISKKEKILILAKTYPSPSAKYGETTCVAGITELGEMRRIYPVPFRMFESDKWFKKWQWVEAETYINTEDKRKESRKIFYDKINPLNTIATDKKWKERKGWLTAVPKITAFLPGKYVTPAVEDGVTLAVFAPDLPVKLEIKKARKTAWDDDELVKLRKVEEMCSNVLFPEDAPSQKIKILEKIPYDFYYRTTVKTTDNREKEIRIKLTDWEVCACYRNCLKDYRDGWQEKFRERIEADMNTKDLRILMGNQHRFEHEWLGISLIYPPKQTPYEAAQSLLFDVDS